jgi:hypothetical protein
MTPVDIIKQRIEDINAKYKRDPTITNYSRKLEAAKILSLVERASPSHPDGTQGRSEVPPSHHHASVDSHRGFNDGEGI